MTSPSAALMPCPFDGGTEISFQADLGAGCRYKCECGVTTARYANEAAARAAWNRRSNPPAGQGAVPRTLSEFVNAPDDVKEKVGMEVVNAAIARQTAEQGTVLDPSVYDETDQHRTAPAAGAGELVERLREAMSRVGKMCSEGRPPKMRIPATPDDDDLFICNTIREAIAALSRPQGWKLVPMEPPDNFIEWLEHEMPSGTVISNARWWAPKIYRAMLSAAPNPDEEDNG